MRKRSFSIGKLSDIGYVKKSNQDRILIKIGEDQLGEFGLFVVADGMGGLASGDKASQIAIMEFKNWWQNELSIFLKDNGTSSINVIDKELSKLVFKINKRIIEFGRIKSCKLGTTLSMLFIYRDKYIIKHVGDSRIYKINEDMIRLTEDHSWVADQIRQGILSQKDAVNHPKRHVLLQCIGVKDTLDIFHGKGEVSEKDIFLLCSDGFYNLLMENEILDVIKINKEDEEDIQNKVERLMKKVKARGAVDNASAILIYQNYNQEKIGVLKKLRDLIS